MYVLKYEDGSVHVYDGGGFFSSGGSGGSTGVAVGR